MRKKLLVIFAHFNPANRVLKNVTHYLSCVRELDMDVDIVFVSTSGLVSSDEHCIDKLVRKIILRENVGYDFYSYRTGLFESEFTSYDKLLFCNDSMLGPFADLNPQFLQISHDREHIWGLTPNMQGGSHLQSYFLVFDKQLARANSFLEFWESVKPLNDKKAVIESYEIGLGRHFSTEGYKSKACFDFQPGYLEMFLYSNKQLGIVKRALKLSLTGRLNQFNQINVTHYFWKHLIEQYRFPFIKKDLVLRNPENIDIREYEQVISRVFGYQRKDLYALLHPI